MGAKNFLKYLPVVFFVCFFISLSIFFYFTPPDKLIGFVGVENAYLLIFVLAFIGGLTTFSGVPYHLVLIALAVGGLNPLFLGFSASIGVMLGDTTSYFIGLKGGELLPRAIQNIFQKMIAFFMRFPRLLPFFFLFYGSFIPFSNDFIVISMGLAKYPFWRVMVPLAIGNIFFNTGLAFLTVYAYNFVQRVFL
ncbi:MAG: hypothetical protein UU87_C0002G0021 [Parcubacteria group bacterium GW2011_GWA2_42_11]|nr:MAG: hypothetical protein UU87_C0002G0021 [Parcubacteria group bacterium GW2011_GWA2_42_11]